MNTTRPPRLYIYGDRVKGSAFIKDAHRRMQILEELMEFQGLDQYGMEHRPYPGVLITVSKVFDEKTINIYTDAGGGEVKPKVKECMCNCNLSVGWILEVQPIELDAYIPMYTIVICQGQRRYEVVSDVLASDFSRYEAGQPILVMPYNDMAYLCCNPVAQQEQPDLAVGCVKVDSEIEDVALDDWRTTVRILPWCGLGLPKWKEVGNG